VSLFVEKDNGIKLETDKTRSSDDRFLARLSFDHLGLMDRALFFLGYLSTLYISVASQASVSK
jgi:hypothetical protein